jgi:hypothetical protein
MNSRDFIIHETVSICAESIQAAPTFCALLVVDRLSPTEFPSGTALGAVPQAIGASLFRIISLSFSFFSHIPASIYN